MNAAPLLHRIARAFAEHRMDAVMIGNAVAAFHGAPVTTLDIDFMFRKTPANINKLKALARGFGASILKPFYPASDLFRIVHEDQGLQIVFMAKVDGIRSYEGLKSRATNVEFGEHSLAVAALADIIKSKRSAGRDRDKAALEILEKTLDEQESDES